MTEVEKAKWTTRLVNYSRNIRWPGPRVFGCFVLEPSAYDVLMRQGYSPENGAREMERAVERLVATPLAALMLKAPPSVGAVARVAAEASGLVMEVG